MWYIHQTCTNYSSWHDLLIPRGGLCPWPTFHAWVTMVRKKWLSIYYSTYWCYIHQTCTNCSSWHDLLIPCVGLCPWPSFQAWLTIGRKKWLKLQWLYLTVLKTNAVNFYIDKYPKVLSFCEITTSKSPRNYWQRISENNKILIVIHTKVDASNARMDMHSVHWRRT